jgi:erythromycin esterase
VSRRVRATLANFAVLVLLGLFVSPAVALGQSSAASWVAWARDHSFPVTAPASVPAIDTYSDLQFFKQVIGDRRLVELGESGHGVGEFDAAKVRLVKFFHEQMGFDVIAFESSIYECFAADVQAAQPDAAGPTIMARSIFGVWWAKETLPLFDYLVASKTTERPLILAGFDSQVSSTRGVLGRPEFFHRVIAAIDADYADQVQAYDRTFVSGMTGNSTNYARTYQRDIVDFYDQLASFLKDHREALVKAFGTDPSPLIAERAARSMPAYVRQLVAFAERPNDLTDAGGGAIRDAAMAENLSTLLREIYPDKKILVWAHNFHLRHANGATSSQQKTMGSFTVAQFRDEVYTIGLYMNRGQAAYNDRSIYAISPALQGSVEWVLFNVGPPALFVDFLYQTPENGNEWIFTPVSAREWGVSSLVLTPRDQYDGVLFIDQVKPPQYLVF